MANSKYEYVRSFEQPDSLLTNTWIVVRIDGRGFSKLTTKYEFVKPNDRNGLNLMNAAAEAVMKELPDLVLAYGNSDEFSFVFHKDCALFERRASKLTTTVVSTFTSYYIYSWSKCFPDKSLTPPLPSFDGRAVCYPSDSNLRDYMSWRQVDCHINNLYNTTFWTLVQQGGMGAREAEQRLKGTVSSDKNEILFKEFGINYNNEPECFKKGTVLYRNFFPTTSAATSSSPTVAAFPSPPIAQSKPTQVATHRASKSIKSAIPHLPDHTVSPELLGPGPTFLSTTSTPSPPLSPPTMSRSAFPNPFQWTPASHDDTNDQPVPSMAFSPPSIVTSPWGNLASSNSKQHLPSLMPLALSAPILKPSTKPPLSLNAPNPTTRTNFSPTTNDFPAAYPIAGYRHTPTLTPNRLFSHSASASLNTSGPSETSRSLKHRSPSQPSLPTFLPSSSSPLARPPPTIPLRMSSIPANSKPRKLTLKNQRSVATLKSTGGHSSVEGENEKNNDVTANHNQNMAAGSATSRKPSPPIHKNKALPTPPNSAEEEKRTRKKVMAGSPDQGQQEWSNHTNSNTSTQDQPPARRTSEPNKRCGKIWTDKHFIHPGIAELPATSPAPGKEKTHSRLHSAPTTASLPYPFQGPDVEALSAVSKSRPNPTSHSNATTTNGPVQPTPPLKNSPRSKATKANSGSKAKQDMGKQMETGSWAANTQTQSNEGRPVQMSRTQRDKDRKKRGKAEVMMEHVDIIKDEFWEKRPWILSGRTG
ncbi:Thg1-domain-containing protein [Clathrospora elynae]|uniref:tRNA(His) guanylyltransferase n=1 Tax=Clathrospora elynae TaxID=706981 RepID=A0A6A5SSM6_9PLEO|nr:Thg1-domain-containing protein [Clathrospora elynae]